MVKNVKVEIKYYINQIIMKFGFGGFVVTHQIYKYPLRRDQLICRKLTIIPLKNNIHKYVCFVCFFFLYYTCVKLVLSFSMGMNFTNLLMNK